jgi:exportin-1
MLHFIILFSVIPMGLPTYSWHSLSLSQQQLKLVMDSIIWAFRHTERNIAETGLNLLLEMLKNFQV